MSDFNLDCKVSGCEREAVDSSGLCSKHKTASDKPEALGPEPCHCCVCQGKECLAWHEGHYHGDKPEGSASVEESAREAANSISNACGEFGPEDGGYNTILKAISAAIAPVVAERGAWQRRAEGMKLGNENLQREIARLATAEIRVVSDLKAELEQAREIIDAAQAKGAQQP